MPDYEVVPEEEAGQISRRRRAKPRMPTFTIERYGGRLIYFWFGMRFGVLMKLFKRGRFSFTLNCIPDTLLFFLWVPWNSVLYWISEAKYRKRAEAAAARRAAHLRHRPLAHRHHALARSLLGRSQPRLSDHLRMLLPASFPADRGGAVQGDARAPAEEAPARRRAGRLRSPAGGRVRHDDPGRGHALHHPCLAALRSRRHRISRLQGRLRRRPKEMGRCLYVALSPARAQACAEKGW